MSAGADPAPSKRPGLRRRHGDAAAGFRLLADFAPVMIWVASPDRNHVYFNRPWLEFTGREAEEQLGMGWAEGVHPEDREALLAKYERGFAAAVPFEAEFRLRRHDGEYRWLIDKVVPLREAGALQGFAGSCLDITERAQADERRAEQLACERSARAEAESATRARDQFLAIVSHELRSPLNGIKSWTHVLENQLPDPDPTTRRALAGIMIGVEHQVRLIDDLLDVTRAMGGNLGLAKQRMTLLPALCETVEGLRATALEKGVELETEYELGDREIHGDPDRIRQIFMNLVANAIKFTPRDGHVHVSARVEDCMACVEVTDDGAGIPSEFLPYVFDPFRQADQGVSKRSQDGMGLGLALVRRLAELHGGHVTCESAGAGQGATLRVYLPLRPESGARMVVERPDRMASGLPSLAGVRVLLIDDQREARESLAALLAQTGAVAATAASCQEAMAHLAMDDGGQETEVIVCDIAMPGEDGYATLRRIRAWEGKHPRRARRPAIALSAFTQREDRNKALAEGFQMHLTKPVAPAELITVISAVARGARL